MNWALGGERWEMRNEIGYVMNDEMDIKTTRNPPPATILTRNKNNP